MAVFNKILKDCRGGIGTAVLAGILCAAVCLHAGANGAAICLTELMAGHAAVFNLPGVTFFAAAGTALAAAALYKTKEVFSKS